MAKNTKKGFNVQDFLANNGVKNSQGDNSENSEKIQKKPENLYTKIIPVEKVYTYMYKKRLKSGKDVFYKHRYTKVTTNKDGLNNEVHKAIVETQHAMFGLNSINRLLNSVIANKCYNKSNMTKQVNKLENAGLLDKDTRNVIKRAYDRKYKLATEIQEIVMHILKLYDMSDAQIENIKAEMNELVKR